MQLIFGLGTPLQLEGESVIVGAFTKMIYALPTNSSEFAAPREQPNDKAAASFSVINRDLPDTDAETFPEIRTNRWNLYRGLVSLLELYDLGGRACLLKSICEAVVVPFDEASGIFEQLIQILFTWVRQLYAFRKIKVPKE